VIVLLINSISKAMISFMWDYAWVPVILNESVVLAMMIFVGYNLVPAQDGVWLRDMNDLLPLLSAQNFINENTNNNSDEEIRDVDPWDLSKTIAIEWPHQRLSQNTEKMHVTQIPISLAYEEKYGKEQENKKDTEN